MKEEGTEKTQEASPLRTALLRSARELFDEKGYDAATIEEITRRAGTAKGSFYTYFRTKSDVILEEYLQIDEYCLLAARNLDRIPRARDRLLALSRERMRYIRDQVGLETLRRLFVNNLLDSGPRKALLDPSPSYRELVLEILRDGMASGELGDGESVDRLALHYERAHRSVCMDWVLTNGGFDPVLEAQDVCETLLAAFTTAG